MNNYKVEFIVNGKVNQHGLCVSADCILCAATSADEILHNVYDGSGLDFEIISISSHISL